MTTAQCSYICSICCSFLSEYGTNWRKLLGLLDLTCHSILLPHEFWLFVKYVFETKTVEKIAIYLFDIVFSVSLPSGSIYGKNHFVASDPKRTCHFSLCRHCTNRVLCTQINLKIVCSVCFCPWTPCSISPGLIQSAVVWIMNTIIICACRHSSIWYYCPLPLQVHILKRKIRKT